MQSLHSHTFHEDNPMFYLSEMMTDEQNRLATLIINVIKVRIVLSHKGYSMNHPLYDAVSELLDYLTSTV